MVWFVPVVVVGAGAVVLGARLLSSGNGKGKGKGAQPTVACNCVPGLVVTSPLIPNLPITKCPAGYAQTHLGTCCEVNATCFQTSEQHAKQGGAAVLGSGFNGLFGLAQQALGVVAGVADGTSALCNIPLVGKMACKAAGEQLNALGLGED